LHWHVASSLDFVNADPRVAQLPADRYDFVHDHLQELGAMSEVAGHQDS
jgi:hypothetical protein